MFMEQVFTMRHATSFKIGFTKRLVWSQRGAREKGASAVPPFGYHPEMG
jgi:hypothetical protein